LKRGYLDRITLFLLRRFIMRFFAFCSARACCVGFAVTANGSILSGLRAGLSALEDNDYEVALTGGDLTVDVGDSLLAIAEFPAFADHLTGTDYANFTPATKMVTAVSLATVTVKTDLTGGLGISFRFDLGAAPPAAWAALGVPGIPAGTVFAVFEDPVSPPGTPAGGHIDNTAVPAGIVSASEGALLATFGFTPGGSPPEFFLARTFDAAGAADVITSITALTVYGGLNYTAPPAAGVPPLAAHNFLGSPASGVPLADKALFTGPTILQLQGSLGSISPGAWAITTDTDGYVSRIVPEPMSAVIWASIAAIVCGSAWHRRRIGC
jgi:hypothetical protein